MPVRRPLPASRWLIRRAVVVLPLVPVTATTGMRPSSPCAKRVSITASPTARPRPKEGEMCMRRPGAALTSTTPPCCSSSGRSTFSQTMSTPQMCRPTICAASTARAATSGCTVSVTSVAVPPVERLALLRSTTRWPSAGTLSGVRPCASRRPIGDVVEPDLGQRGRMAFAAARVLVDRVDQFANRSWCRRRSPAADRGGPRPPGGRPRPAGGSRSRAGISRPSPRHSTAAES